MTTTTVKVEVTQKDIDEGVPNNCGSCPLATALTRAIGKPIRVRVASFGVGHGHMGMLPTTAIRFRQDFDNLRTVAPLTFEVSVPA